MRKFYARLVFDRDCTIRLLNEVLAADPRRAGLTLINTLAKSQGEGIARIGQGLFLNCGKGNKMNKTYFCGAGIAVHLGRSLAAATTIKIATVAPDGTAWMREMRAGARCG